MQGSCIYIYAQFVPIMIFKMYLVHRAVGELFLVEGGPDQGKGVGNG